MQAAAQSSWLPGALRSAAHHSQAFMAWQADPGYATSQGHTDLQVAGVCPQQTSTLARPADGVLSHAAGCSAVQNEAQEVGLQPSLVYAALQDCVGLPVFTASGSIIPLGSRRCVFFQQAIVWHAYWSVAFINTSEAPAKPSLWCAVRCACEYCATTMLLMWPRRTGYLRGVMGKRLARCVCCTAASLHWRTFWTRWLWRFSVHTWPAMKLPQHCRRLRMLCVMSLGTCSLLQGHSCRKAGSRVQTNCHGWIGTVVILYASCLA